MRKFTLFLLCMGLLITQLYAQSKKITGKVTDEKGSPISNATIVVKGTKIGTTTSNDGNFSLNASENSKTIVISYINYLTKEVGVSDGFIEVQLSRDEKNLDEVVITGYTREKKSNYSGSVSKVEAKAINQVPNGSIDQILQGRAAGLYATAGSGQPGAAANVIIRGVTSIGGVTTPLYIMDGIPIQAAAFSALSPSDIESVNVLKDAASTALYGSRGANGVIVITTKRGKNTGKIAFGAKSQFGFSNRTTPKFEMMNSQQRIQFEEEVGAENGQNIGPGWIFSRKNPANAALPAATLARYDFIKDSLSNANVDWPGLFFRQGNTQEHEINASAGTDKFSFYSSVNYFKQQGIALRSELERYSFRNNLDFKTEKFTAGLSTSINFAKSSFIENENTTGVTNPFASAYYALPYEQPYINGVLVHSGNASGPSTANPLVPATAGRVLIYDQREGSTAVERGLATSQNREEIKVVLGANFRYKIIEDLAVTSTLGLDYRQLVGDRFINPNTYTGSIATGGKGSFAETYNKFMRLYGNAGFNYTKTFAQKHAVDVVALYESIKSTARTFNYTGYGLNPLLPNTPAAITAGSATGFIPLVGGTRDGGEALQSFIGIAKYVFDGKYTFNGNYRLDGSSTLPEKNRWRSFYSFGASWNIKKENFFDNIRWVDDLQLRGSYGLTASPFPQPFAYLATYGNARYDGVTGLAPTQIANDDYDWEYTRQVNIGVDFTLAKKRVRGTIELYRKKTENLFINQQLSRTSGANALSINAGSMENKGVELTLAADVISRKNFTWTVGGNISYNKNEITSLGQVNEFVQGTAIIRVGLPFGSHYLPKWGGVDPANGNALYFNLDGTTTTTYNRPVQSVAEFGSWLPKYQGGFNTSINFKQFYVEAFFSFAAGNKRFNNEDFFNESSNFAASNQSTRILNRWRKAGDITDIQKFGTTRQFSSKDIQDCSYIRFRNLNIGYNFTKETLSKGFLKNLNALSFYVQAQNLATFTSWRGFDPEDNNNISTFEYPAQKTVTVGMNLSF